MRTCVSKKNRIRIRRWIPALAVVLMLVFSLPVTADEDYGDEAYSYLRTITDQYGNRVNNKDVVPNQDQKTAAGEWINSIMQSFGYTATIITNEADMSRERGNFVKDYCYFKQGARPERIVIGAHYDCVTTHGTEDNGTGVSVLLELAHRMKSIDTTYSLEFCFWDGEEYLGQAGSFHYVASHLGADTLKDVVLYINFDCVGSGDHLFVYGGDWDGNLLVRSWGYNLTRAIGSELGIDLHTLPTGLPTFFPPVSTSGSDQLFFADQKIPYVYFACTRMIDEDGTVVCPEAPAKFHTADPRVPATANGIRGQIIHTEYDDMTILDELFPGRFKQHFSEVLRISIRILETVTPDTPAAYADPAPVYKTSAVVPPTEAPTEPPKPTEAPTEPPKPTAAPTEAPTVPPAVSSSEAETVPEPTGKETEPVSTDAGTPAETSAETEPVTPAPTEPLPGTGNEPAPTEAPGQEPAAPSENPLTTAEILAIAFIGTLAVLWGVVLVIHLRRRK